jgi:hypothetical protein
MVEGFRHVYELPDDNWYVLAVWIFGPSRQGREEIWTAERNLAGHTIITVGEQQFIYDAMNKGLRAIVKSPDGRRFMTKPFDTPSCDVSAGV